MSRGVLVFFLCLAGCLRSEPVNEVRDEFLSPDGKKKVVVFSRDAGTATGSNIQASIIDEGEKLPNEPGNVFVIDNGEAKVSWQKDNSLLVVVDGHARVFKKETVVRGVSISYRDENARP